MNRSAKCLISAALISMPLALPASPTSDEFQYCADRSSEELKSCLYQQLNKEDQQCWQRAQQLYDFCNRQVIEKYKR